MESALTHNNVIVTMTFSKERTDFLEKPIHDQIDGILGGISESNKPERIF